MMPGSGMSNEEVAAVISELVGRGADVSCPSCQARTWSGWEVGAIPRFVEETGTVDWVHGLAISALICNQCGFIRLHTPWRSG